MQMGYRILPGENNPGDVSDHVLAPELKTSPPFSW